MSANLWLCQSVAFVLYFVLTSFTEWVFHRYAFHTPKFGFALFRAHTMIHHQIYKDDTYQTHEEHPGHVPMSWWACPAMVAAHLPIFWLVQTLTGIPSLWGGVLAITAYFGIYESIHWAMHVPRAARLLNRFRPYRFLDAHHRTHHRFMLSNLNVVLPLADLALGTLRAADGRRIGLLSAFTHSKNR